MQSEQMLLMIWAGGLGAGARTKTYKTRDLIGSAVLHRDAIFGKVSQVSPPVAFCGFPELELNVPEPVSVILVPSLAIAVACPPGETVSWRS
jgi:hypothetical protein